jgi:hypothetical protein
MAVTGVQNGIHFTFEVMDLKPGCDPPEGQGVGVIIKTQTGTFIGGRGAGRFVTDGGEIEQFKRTSKADPTNLHMQNFFDAVLVNDRTKLRSDCRIAAKSSSMAHMANISYQLGRACDAVDIESQFAKTDAEKSLINRMMQAPKIYHRKHGDSATQWKIGPALSFDNATQKFNGTGAEAANAKMTRENYRKGFEFPTA